MGRILTIGIYLIVLSGFIGAASAQAPATQPTTAPSTVVPPAVPPTPPGGWIDGRPGVYWTPHAQYPQYPQGRESFEPRETDFSRNHFELNLGGQGYTAYGHGGSNSIGFVTLGASYYVVDGLSIGLEGGLSPGTYDDGHRQEDDFGDHHGDRFRLRAEEALALLRWHFLNCGPLSLYGEVGLGGLHASHQFPSGGRSDNALGVAGLGISWRVVDHWYLAAGGRYARIGDDWDDGHHHRHGFDGVQYYGGVSFIP